MRKTFVFFITAACLVFYGLSIEAARSNRENPVVKAVRRVSPAVVNISSEYPDRNQINPFGDSGFAPFFDSFFKDFFDPHAQQRPERSALGSGVIIVILGHVAVNERLEAFDVMLARTDEDEDAGEDAD